MRVSEGGSRPKYEVKGAPKMERKRLAEVKREGKHEDYMLLQRPICCPVYKKRGGFVHRRNFHREFSLL